MARGKFKLKSKRFAENKSFHEPNFLAGLFFLEIVSLHAEVRTIPLTQGKFALVDAEDYVELSKFRWCACRNRTRFYAVRNACKRNGRQKKIHMHRVILNTPVGMDTDHRNRDGLDNRRQNLRACTRSENLRNTKSYRDSSSRFKGVSWNKANMKWQVDIMFDGKKHYLGCFTSEVEAAKCYDVAAKELFGEFAYFNFQDAK